MISPVVLILFFANNYMKYSESDKSHFVRNGNIKFAIKRPTELQLIRHTFIKRYNQTQNNIIVLVKLEGAANMT